MSILFDVLRDVAQSFRANSQSTAMPPSQVDPTPSSLPMQKAALPRSPNANTVVVLSGHGANDAINGLMSGISEALTAGGLNIQYIDLSLSGANGLSPIFELTQRGEVLFAVSYLGIGEDLHVGLDSGDKTNLWEYFNIPFLKFHGDSPAYFLSRHGDTPKTSVHLYGATEFIEFRNWALPAAKSLACACPPLLMADTPLQDIDFNKKQFGKLLFLKNGGNPEDLVALWKARLQPELTEILMELAGHIVALGLKTGKFSILGTVLKYFESQYGTKGGKGIEQLVRLCTAQLDDYLRRIKSTLLANTLKSFPIVIAGAGWEHIDKSNAIALFRPGWDSHTTNNILQKELGLIDMTPNIDSTCHDRLSRAAGTYTSILTNRTSWLGQNFPSIQETAFEFTEESIHTAVSRALGNPKATVEQGIHLGKQFRLNFTSEEFSKHFRRVAELTRIANSLNKPELQNYYVW